MVRDAAPSDEHHWTTVEVPVEARRLVGSVGRVLRTVVDEARVSAFASVSPAAPVGVATPTGVSLVACCPDPIVLACRQGLPRLRILDRAIDGGTEWLQHRPLRVGERLDLLSRLASVDARRAADGRLMLRTVVEVHVHAEGGEEVGVVRGTSLDVGERSR